MCNPDYTLVPNVAGNEETDFVQPAKMCQDWDGLREWAEKWHGDYFDEFGVQEGERGYDDERLFGNYRVGDGLPVGGL